MNPSNNRTGQLKFNNKHLVSVSHAAATIALAAAARHLAALAALSPDLALAAAPPHLWERLVGLSQPACLVFLANKNSEL